MDVDPATYHVAHKTYLVQIYVNWLTKLTVLMTQCDKVLNQRTQSLLPS